MRYNYGLKLIYAWGWAVSMILIVAWLASIRLWGTDDESSRVLLTFLAVTGAWWFAYFVLIRNSKIAPDGVPAGKLFVPLVGAVFLWLLLLKTSVVSVVIAVFVLILPTKVVVREWLAEQPTLRRWFVTGRGASSKLAGPKELSRHVISLANGGDYGVSSRELYLGATLFENDLLSRPIGLKGDAHLLSVAQTAAGKSLTVIWPNLAIFSGSMFVIDPKGEHARAFFARRGTGDESLGIPPLADNAQAWVLDPLGVCPEIPSQNYNVFSEIDPASPKARSRISSISAACIETSSDPRSKFWEESGRLILEGMIAHVLTTQPEKNRNLPFVADMLTGINPETGQVDMGYLAETLVEMQDNSACGGLPQKAAAAYERQGHNAIGSLTMEMEVGLKWVSDPRMRKHLVGDGPCLQWLAHPGVITTFFICLPFDDMNEHMRWLRCLTGLAMSLLQGYQPKPSPPVVFLLDELPQYGKGLACLKQAVTTARGSGIRLSAFIQHISQLEECFGKAGANDFISSSSKQFFGANDSDTAKYIATLLGQHQAGNNSQQSGTDIADLNDILTQLGKSTPHQYYFPCDGRPMFLERRTCETIVTDEGQTWRGLGLARHYVAPRR